MEMGYVIGLVRREACRRFKNQLRDDYSLILVNKIKWLNVLCIGAENKQRKKDEKWFHLISRRTLQVPRHYYYLLYVIWRRGSVLV